MSELSSQAYDGAMGQARSPAGIFRFPPLGADANHLAGNGRDRATRRNRIASRFRSGEHSLRHGNTTEDLAVNRGEGFELLVGRNQPTARLLASGAT